jgi:branched-chain amino acid transport system substrate-binding protein
MTQRREGEGEDMLGKTMALALTALMLAPAAARAADSYDINVILPMTGGASFVGKGQHDSLEALAAVVNKAGGIGGKPLKWIYHDDTSSPQLAVQLANDILAEKPSVMIGSSIVAMCAAIAPLMKNGPVDYCLSPGYHPGPGSFVFSASSSSIDQFAATVRYYRMMGWTKIAMLSTTDASGQDGDHAIDQVLALPENKDVRKVAQEHFNPTDISVAAQIEHIKASGAQALIAWTTGAPAATVFKGAIQAGLDIPLAPTSGNQTFAQMAQWLDFLPPKMLMPSALFPEHDGLYKLDPAVEKAQHDMYGVLKERGLKADNMEATSWDAGLIVVGALQKLGPNATAEQIRSYIANLTGFAGIDGVYDFKANPERGLGPDSSIVTRYDAKEKAWVWLTKPGGAPLK